MRGHKLRLLNLDDNLLPTLKCLEPLRELQNLQDLTLQSKQTNNPVCRHAKYLSTLLALLPQLETLDGRPVEQRMEPGIESRGKPSVPVPVPSPGPKTMPKPNPKPKLNPMSKRKPRDAEHAVDENDSGNTKGDSALAKQELQAILQNVFRR
jgi:hypothetical protein